MTKSRSSRLLVVVLVSFTWLLVALLTIPRAISRGVADYGFITGIAERLRAGDRLYVDVWDNKDPLIYYALTVARSFGPNGVIGAWLLELAWIVVAAVAIYVIARHQSLDRAISSYVGLGLAPLVIVGASYFMGNTHLPGIALLLAVVALLYSRHPLTAGLLLGILLFFKLVMIPTSLVVVAATLIVLRRKQDVKWILFGFASAAAMVVLMLAIRGELAGFLATQPDNVAHSQSPIVSPDGGGVIERLKRYLVILVNPQIAAIQFTTLVILLVSRPKSDRRMDQTTALWWITVSAFVMAVGTIAVTGKWFHHAQVLEVSSTLALVLVTHNLLCVRRVRRWIAAGIAAFLTYPLAGLPQPYTYADAITQFPTRWVQSTNVDTLTAIMRERAPGAVSFIGETVPQARGLEEWSIACRHIGQRPFNPKYLFDETIDCLPSSDVVVVSQNLDTTSNFPAYDAFLTGVRTILDEGYVCEEMAGFLICESRERV